MMKIVFAVSAVTALFFVGSSFSAFADNGIISNNDNGTLAKLVLECQKQDNLDKICTLFNLIQTIQRTPGPPGPAGSPGSQILAGGGIPNLSLGTNNDFYLDNSTGNYYKKISGTWTVQGNLRGQPGSPGAQGLSGPPGPRGFNGTNGAQGLPGPQGLPGIVGQPGSQIFTDVGSPNLLLGSNNDFYLDTSSGNYYKKISGTWTAQGSLRGPPGSPGTQGPRGFNGTNGINGAQGLPGTPGPPGPRGFNGTNGAIGPAGPQGPRGFNGTNGSTGPQGPPGDIGPQGPIGPRGFNGTDGSQGLPGPPGPRGFNGTDGSQGLPGQAGPQGLPGPRGFNGTNGSIGPAGPQGPIGPRGFNGTNGINGAQGLPGPIGPRGFNGTNGINGAQGLPGPIGPRGFNGTNGAIGPAGPQGPVGPRGFNGTNGINGAIGPRGFNGTNGAQGLPGSQIFTARGIPSSSLGSNNDFYLDNSTGNYYKKISNSWTVQGNLVGPQGPPGTPANTTALQNQINSLNQQLLFTQLNSAAFNLVSYWKFDGGSTGLADFSGLGNNGVVTGTTSFVPGKIGNAFSFNGVTYMVSTAPSLSTSFSIVGWANLPATASGDLPKELVSNDVENNYFLRVDPNSESPNRLAGFVKVGGTPEPRVTYTYLPNTWFHFALTWDGTTLKLYINGVLQSQQTRSGILSGSGTSIGIGGATGGVNLLKSGSLLDDIRIYNKALSSTEVSTIFHS